MKIIIIIFTITITTSFALPTIVHNTGIADFIQYNQYLFVDISGLADDALNSRNFKSAETLYYDCFNLAKSKKNHKLIGYSLLGLGTFYRIKSQYDSVLSKLNQCLNYKDNIADSLPISLIYYNLALSHHYLNNLDSALLNYNSALNYYPFGYWTLINRGDAYRDKQEYSDAISDYLQYLDKDSTNADVMVNIAEVYLIKNNKIDARHWYEQALKSKNSFTIFKESDIQEKINNLPVPDKN